MHGKLRDSPPFALFKKINLSNLYQPVTKSWRLAINLPPEAEMLLGAFWLCQRAQLGMGIVNDGEVVSPKIAKDCWEQTNSTKHFFFLAIFRYSSRNR